MRCIYCQTEDDARFDVFAEEDRQREVGACRDCLNELAVHVLDGVEDDLNGILATRISGVVGHSEWPGDVDPPSVNAMSSALTDVVRQLIENGVSSIPHTPPKRDVEIVESDIPRDPEDKRPRSDFMIYVDGAFRGACKTRPNAERARAFELARPLDPQERAVNALAPLREDDRIKFVGIEHTGGGCTCAAVYTENESDGYVWITESAGYVGEDEAARGEFLIGVYNGTDDAEGQPEDWNEDLSGVVNEAELLDRVRSILDEIAGVTS